MSTDKFNVLFVHPNGKNCSTCAFQLQILGKELWSHIDGTDSAPNKKTHKETYVKWKVKYAQVMAWIIGFVDHNIVINLLPFTTWAIFSIF